MRPQIHLPKRVKECETSCEIDFFFFSFYSDYPDKPLDICYSDPEDKLTLHISVISLHDYSSCSLHFLQ